MKIVFISGVMLIRKMTVVVSKSNHCIAESYTVCRNGIKTLCDNQKMFLNKFATVLSFEEGAGFSYYYSTDEASILWGKYALVSQFGDIIQPDPTQGLNHH